MPRSELVREHEVLTRDYRLASFTAGFAFIASGILPTIALIEIIQWNARVEGYPTLASTAIPLVMAGYYLNAAVNLQFERACLRRSPAYSQARDAEKHLGFSQAPQINPGLTQEASF